jgi:hypothetical protein
MNCLVPLPGDEFTDDIKTSIIERVLTLSDTDLWRVGVLLEVMKREIGAFSPAEEFISQILLDYNVHAGLTPANVISELKNFTDNFSEMIAFAKEAPERYPSLVKPPRARAAEGAAAHGE